MKRISRAKREHLIQCARGLVASSPEQGVSIVTLPAVPDKMVAAIRQWWEAQYRGVRK